MKIYDISMTIQEDMQVYRNDPKNKPELKITRDFGNSSARETRLSMNMHTGTHLDMPLHFIPEGNTVETLDISRLVTKCRVIDFTSIQEAIHADDLLPLDIKENETILFKTRNSFSENFDPDFVYLASDGAKLLADKRINCVGIDSLGIERAQPEHGTHKTLLGSEIVIIEGLRLKDIDPGEYTLHAVPIKISGVEAAPVRALLIENTGA